jgi:AcrR family transcriptional regulator
MQATTACSLAPPMGLNKTIIQFMLTTMARPVAADAEATKARILAAATSLIAERGIDGTTVRDIARHARVSLATVLHYFESKDGLHAAVVAAMDAELITLRDALFQAVTPGLALDETVDMLVRRAWEFACAHHVAHRIILRTVLDDGGLPAERIESILRPSLDDASAVLAVGFHVDPIQARLMVQSIVQLSARYAIASTDELCAVTAASDLVTARARVGDHLARLMRGLLWAAQTRRPPAASDTEPRVPA